MTAVFITAVLVALGAFGIYAVVRTRRDHRAARAIVAHRRRYPRTTTLTALADAVTDNTGRAL